MNNVLGKHIILILIYTICININSLFAQTDTSSYYNKNLWELSQIYVSSEKKSEQKLSNTPSTFHVITNKDIEESGFFTLEDVLAELPGFQFRNILGLNSYSFLRGLPRQNNAILVLIDGIQINELNSGGFYGGGNYNLANVDRIEVMYGPASVIYGSNAISGIINIITKNPKKDDQFEINSAVGNFNTYLSDLTFSKITDNISLKISGMYKTSHKADLSGKNNDYLWDDNLEIFETDYALDTKINYKKLTIGSNYQNRRSSTSTYYPSFNTIYKDYGTLWNLQLVNSYIKYNTSISDKIKLHSLVYNRNATILGNSVKEVTDTGQIAYYRPNDQLGTENIFEINLGKSLNILSGVFGYWEKLSENYSRSFSNEFFVQPEKPLYPNTIKNTLAGIFIQADYGFFNFWRFVPGIRIEHNSSYHTVIIPRTTLIYDKERFVSKLIYARAFRAPKPWDFTDGTGNPDLKPEYFNSYEISGSWFASDNIKTDISAFYNNLENGLVKVNPDENSFYWDNAENSVIKGAEFSTTISVHNLKTFINYAYYNSLNNANQEMVEISPHTGMLGFNYNILNHLKAGTRFYYYGKKKNPKLISATNSYFVDQAVVINLFISIVNYYNTDFKIIIKNLTNTEYYHTSNLAPDRFRQPQFTILFKVSYKINKL